MTDERNHEIRLAVAESRLDAHAQMIENNQALSGKLIDRLDIHIRDQAKRDVEVSDAINENTLALSHCTAAIDEWKTAVNVFSKTITRVVGGVVISVGALWAVFAFYVEHVNTPQVIEQLKK